MVVRCRCASCGALFYYEEKKLDKIEEDGESLECKDCRRVYTTGVRALHDPGKKMARRYETFDEIQKDLGFRIDHAPVATREAMKRKRIHWK